MQKYLMCPPDYFDIEYSINPWMNTATKADADKSEQWKFLKQTLESLGVEVSLLEPQKGLPDMTYVDAGLLYEGIFIPSNFKFKERQGERPHLVAWFKQAGYEIADLDDAVDFEGHGDSLWADDNLYLGCGFRTDKAAHGQIHDILRGKGFAGKIYSMELVDPRFYHLDTCFCPLGDDAVMYVPSALSDEANAIIESNFKKRYIVSDEESKLFACNSVVIGKHIVMPAGAYTIAKELEADGYTVHQVPMTEFIKGGGACKCLSMPLE